MRSSELLFAYLDIASDGLFFLDVRDHGAFADDELVEILHRNWPGVIARFRGSPAPRSGDRLTPEQRREVRRAGITPITQLKDGTTYFPFTGGMSTWVRPGARAGESGLSVRAVSDADRILNEVDRVERWLREEAPAIAARLSNDTGRPFDELRVELRLEDGKWVMVETQSGHEVP